VNADETGWLLYDGECRWCVKAARRVAPLLRRHRFETAPLQTPGLRERAGLKAGEPLVEMKLLAGDGAVFGGVEAILHIVRRIWWARPLYVLAFVPGVKGCARRLYRHVAARRDCFSGTCAPEEKRISDNNDGKTDQTDLKLNRTPL